MGVPELESGTSSLSATRSNQLSYTPAIRRQATGVRQQEKHLYSWFPVSGTHMGSGKFTELETPVKGKFAIKHQGLHENMDHDRTGTAATMDSGQQKIDVFTVETVVQNR